MVILYMQIFCSKLQKKNPKAYSSRFLYHVHNKPLFLGLKQITHTFPGQAETKTFHGRILS